jgi:LCP family protein required for cell wall assembly
MDNFRKGPRQPNRRAVDGILNAPSRPQLTGRPFDRRALNGDTFRTPSRTIGDFKRPAGYHVANTQVSTSPTKSKSQPENSDSSASMLHMTLPGGKKAASAGKLRGLRGRHASKVRGKRDWKKISIRSGLVVLALIVLLGGALFVKGYLKLNKVFKGGGNAAALNANVDPSLLRGEGDGRVNILLLGRGGEGHAGGDLTDTILLASIDPVNNKTALVSIPRDFWVETPNGSSKINAVFTYAKQRAEASGSKPAKAEEAGVRAIKEVASQVLGVPIHYYTMIDFRGFRNAINTVGGVKANITEETAVAEHLWDPMAGEQYYLNVQPGVQHFDGQRALFYARSRHTSARGDFDRAERQKVLISALSKKITSAGTYTNPVKVSKLMDDFGDHVVTDLSLDDAMRLVSIGKKIGSNFESIDLASPSKPLVRTGMIGNQSVVMPAAGVGNFGQIHSLVRSKLKDGYITKENAKITILNGTVTPGLAGEKAAELRTYGYNIGVVTDAPTQDYEETILVDLSKGKNKYTENYLEKRFKIKATRDLPEGMEKPKDVSFVLILGQNETLNR